MFFKDNDNKKWKFASEILAAGQIWQTFQNDTNQKVEIRLKDRDKQFKPILPIEYMEDEK